MGVTKVEEGEIVLLVGVSVELDTCSSKLDSSNKFKGDKVFSKFEVEVR